MTIPESFFKTKRISPSEKMFFLWLTQKENILLSDQQIARNFNVSSTCVKNWIVELEFMRLIKTEMIIESTPIEGTKRIKSKKKRKISTECDLNVFDNWDQHFKELNEKEGRSFEDIHK